MEILWDDYETTMEIIRKLYGYFKQNNAFLIAKSAIKKAVLILSYYLPNTVLLLTEYRPIHKNQKSRLSVLLLSEYSPTPLRILSASFWKKRTTPFGGMALSYYSLATPPFSLFPRSFHIFLSALFIAI